RIAHRLVPIVAAARSEQHGDALVDKRLTSASLYGRFKGAAIPLRLSVVVGKIAAQCAHPRTACTAVTQTLHGARRQTFVRRGQCGRGRTQIDRTATDARATSGVLGWEPCPTPRTCPGGTRRALN